MRTDVEKPPTATSEVAIEEHAIDGHHHNHHHHQTAATASYYDAQAGKLKRKFKLFQKNLKMILPRAKDEESLHQPPNISRPTNCQPYSSSLASSRSSTSSGGQNRTSSGNNAAAGNRPSRHIISAESVTINRELGVGEFGVVQQGVWTNEEGERIQVAIKCLSSERMANSRLEFLKEATIMHQISHEHIVRLYGVVLEPSLMMVTELAPLRSLLECLKEPDQRSNFPITSLAHFAGQIADGMAYLESKRLIHRDLAARNVLVFGKMKVKISDFGLSRALGVGKDYYQTNFNVNLKLPIAWCAPECINYLKFTSQTDVWAYGVTLWEMFSYGFQPWAALTGQQILEAIDEPSYQRLERPECCPKEYYGLMMKCWAHDANQRPKFSEIVTLLPDCKPELVQAVKDFDGPAVAGAGHKEMLAYKVGNIITVLDKRTASSGPEDGSGLWKGALNNGRVGYFDPSDVVTYLGQNLPTSASSLSTSTVTSTNSTSASTIASTVLQSNFIRGFLDSRPNGSGSTSPYSSNRARKLRPDMISRPQGDLKHTGHVGADGVYFGDVGFLTEKYQQLPKQVVQPYQDSPKGSDSDFKNHKLSFTHEYQEIGPDDDNPLESPSEAFDFGPSLMDEVFRELDQIKPDLMGNDEDVELVNESSTNVKNEIKEITTKMKEQASAPASQYYGSGPSVFSTRKKQAMVKPISASDQQELDSAIAMAKDIASRSMLALDDGTDQTDSSPKTPTSPNKRKHFSFKFGGVIQSKPSPKTERRNFSEATESIGHITESITPAAKIAYSTLVDKNQTRVEKQNQSEKQHNLVNEKEPTATITTNESTIEEESEDGNPLRMLRAGGAMGVMRARVRGNRSFSQPRLPTTAQTAGLARVASCATARSNLGTPPPVPAGEEPDCANALPLPPRDRSRPLPVLKTHQRRHPLVLPGSVGSINGDGHYNGGGIDYSHHSGIYPNHHRRESSPAALISTTSKPVLKQVSCPQAPLQFLQSNYGHHQVSPLAKELGEKTRLAPAPPPKPIRSFHNNNNNETESSDNQLLDDIDRALNSQKQAQEQAAQKSAQKSPVTTESPASTTTVPPTTTSTVPSTSTTVTVIAVTTAPAPTPVQQSPTPITVLTSTLSSTIASTSKPLTVISSRLSQSPLTTSSSPSPTGSGRSKGCDSDEVRVMQKVLANENLSDEEAATILGTCDWDVHKAIKCVRLRQQLRSHNITEELDWSEALARFNWNVRQASNYLIATQSGDTTEV